MAGEGPNSKFSAFSQVGFGWASNALQTAISHMRALVASSNNNSPMSLEEFENTFRKKRRYVKYFNYGLCFAIIGVSGLVLYSVIIKYFQVYSIRDKLFLTSIFTFLLAVGVYGLLVLRNKYTLTYWRNHRPKEENLALLHSACSELIKSDIQPDDESTYYLYQKDWWVTAYVVYFFADHNLIAINVDTLGSGLIDFGASRRIQNRILHLMKEKAPTNRMHR